MKSFSQRKGFKPVAEVLQIDSMNSELRNSLWNVLDIEIWSADRFDSLDPFCEALWFKFFKKPLDSRPRGNYPILLEIREYFFVCEWFEVYDFLEFVVWYYKFPRPRLVYCLESSRR